MAGVYVLVALVVGGVLGALSRRGRRPRTSVERVMDSDRHDVQAGWPNTYGGP